MGRREKFLSKAVDQLRADGVSASFFAGDVRWARPCASLSELAWDIERESKSIRYDTDMQNK